MLKPRLHIYPRGSAQAKCKLVMNEHGDIYTDTGTHLGELDAGYHANSGLAGPTGPTGPDVYGAQGPRGAVGDTGCVGLSGQGLPGPTGVTGYDGPMGYIGPVGCRGRTGPQGPRGATGPKGPSDRHTPCVLSAVVTRPFAFGAFIPWENVLCTDSRLALINTSVRLQQQQRVCVYKIEVGVHTTPPDAYSLRIVHNGSKQIAYSPMPRHVAVVVASKGSGGYIDLCLSPNIRTVHANTEAVVIDSMYLVVSEV